MVDGGIEVRTVANLARTYLQTAGLRRKVLEVPLQGKMAPTTEGTSASIQGGVGQATVQLPSEVGVKVEAQGGLGEINAGGLQKEGDALRLRLENAHAAVEAGAQRRPLGLLLSASAG